MASALSTERRESTAGSVMVEGGESYGDCVTPSAALALISGEYRRAVAA